MFLICFDYTSNVVFYFGVLNLANNSYIPFANFDSKLHT